jgi:hypothetical protein
MERIITNAKDDSVVGNIQNLFEDRQHISIIGNAALHSQLVDLANNISNKRENEKKIEDIIKV